MPNIILLMPGNAFTRLLFLCRGMPLREIPGLISDGFPGREFRHKRIPYFW